MPSSRGALLIAAAILAVACAAWRFGHAPRLAAGLVVALAAAALGLALWRALRS